VYKAFEVRISNTFKRLASSLLLCTRGLLGNSLKKISYRPLLTHQKIPQEWIVLKSTQFTHLTALCLYS